MIHTSSNYKVSFCCYEIVDDEIVTDSSQYLDLGTAIRKMMRGELDDVYVPGIRDPRGDKFEIIDSIREYQQKKAEEQRQPEQPEQPEQPVPSPKEPPVEA